MTRLLSFRLKPLRRLATLGAAAAIALSGALAPARAQLADSVDGANLQSWRLARGNEIGFCVFDTGVTAPFNRAVGAAIAERLLLNSRFTSLQAGFGVDGEYMEGELYTALVNDCDIVLGLRVDAGMYAPDFTVARPYVSYDYVLVGREDDYETIEDIPRGARIGTQLASGADFALARFIALRREDDRWMRLPYGTLDLMLERLKDGTIEAGVIFGPVFARFQAERPEAAEGLAAMPTPREVAASSNIGGLMLARNAWLRMQIDQAITDMVDDGSIDRLLDEHGFGAIPAVPGGI